MDKRHSYYLIILVLCAAIFIAIALSPYADIAISKKQTGAATEQPLVLKEEAEKINLSALSFLSVFVSPTGETKTLAEKNTSDHLPIASITKLMTAIIAFDNYHQEEIMAISNKALDSKGRSWMFEPGEIFKVSDLLHALLLESNNDAAETLAIRMSKERFVEAMNLKARNLGLKDTVFINPTGLDPDEADGFINYSNAEDLFKISRAFLEKYPLLLNITSKKDYDLYTADGEFHHKIENTNELLFADWRDKNGETIKILGGKTGETPFSKQNLILIVEAPNASGYIVNIVLGSPERFNEMKKLVEWTFDAYAWQNPK